MDLCQKHLYFSDNNCLEVVFFLFPQFSLNFGSHRKNVCTWICKMYETKYHNNTSCQ